MVRLLLVTTPPPLPSPLPSMLRPSLLLLLLVAAAACAPNSPKEQQGCADLGKIPEPTRFFVRHVPHSPATVKDGGVTCPDDTPVLFYLAKDGAATRADSMTCTNGLWIAADGFGGTKTFNTTDVMCYGKIHACGPLDPISQEDLNKRFPKNSPACTPPDHWERHAYCRYGNSLVYTNKEGLVRFTAKMTCNDLSDWDAVDHLDRIVETSNACCVPEEAVVIHG